MHDESILMCVCVHFHRPPRVLPRPRLGVSIHSLCVCVCVCVCVCMCACVCGGRRTHSLCGLVMHMMLDLVVTQPWAPASIVLDAVAYNMLPLFLMVRAPRPLRMRVRQQLMHLCACLHARVCMGAWLRGCGRARRVRWKPKLTC